MPNALPLHNSFPSFFWIKSYCRYYYYYTQNYNKSSFGCLIAMERLKIDDDCMQKINHLRDSNCSAARNSQKTDLFTVTVDPGTTEDFSTYFRCWNLHDEGFLCIVLRRYTCANPRWVAFASFCSALLSTLMFIIYPEVPQSWMYVCLSSSVHSAFCYIHKETTSLNKFC